MTSLALVLALWAQQGRLVSTDDVHVGVRPAVVVSAPGGRVNEVDVGATVRIAVRWP